MKKQKIIRLVTLGLGSIMLFLLVGVGTTFAATVRLNNITIPRGGSRISPSFNVSNRGIFSVRVRLRTKTLIGFGGQSRYRAELMRGNTVLVARSRTVSSGFETVTLTYNVANCNQTGSYRIRVRNVPGVNPQQGEAAFPVFSVPSLNPTSGNLPLFGVTQGNTVNRSIPNSLQPSGTGGRIRITATWDGICGLNPAGCRLTFRLKRNGTTIRTSNGYAHNALFGNASPKMTINYNVPSNMVTGTWGLQVVGTTIASVSNVKTKVSFTPVCQN